jgi:hypothetical protein
VLGLQLNNPIFELDIGHVSAKKPDEDAVNAEGFKQGSV